jgi:hypothetical protein
MKAISVLGILAGLVGSIALGEPLARAQSEIDPDHFESSNAESFEKAKTNGRA